MPLVLFTSESSLRIDRERRVPDNLPGCLPTTARLALRRRKRRFRTSLRGPRWLRSGLRLPYLRRRDLLRLRARLCRSRRVVLHALHRCARPVEGTRRARHRRRLRCRRRTLGALAGGNNIESRRGHASELDISTAHRGEVLLQVVRKRGLVRRTGACGDRDERQRADRETKCILHGVDTPRIQVGCDFQPG